MSNQILPSPKGRQTIYLEIESERHRQDAEWGGPEHDDEHNITDWATYIDKQRYHLTATRNPAEVKRRLVKIAALATAALESLERKADQP